MRNLITSALAIAAFAVLSMNVSSAEAQSYHNGYGFGAGIGFGQCRGFSNFDRPPYFAQFPPVYYSHIVRRPYGISPYAAPPGIAPVELNAPSQPVTISNPFFDQEVAPVSLESVAPAEVPASDDVTWIRNPYIETFAFNN